MKKKDINTKYGMDGKCINRRIEEMLGHNGVKNYTDAKIFLKDQDLNKIVDEINLKLSVLDEKKGVKKEISDKEEFLKNIQEKQSKELCQYYDMDRTTLNRRIYEMLGDKEVKNYSEAKKYLEDKDIKEIAEEIEYKENIQKERYEGTTLISDKKQFFEDILNMQKKEIDMKYGLDAKTTNKKIEEILGDYGVKNYTGAKEYLKDNGVDEVLKTIEKKEGGKESQDKPLEEFDQTPEKVINVEEIPKNEESEEKEESDDNLSNKEESKDKETMKSKDFSNLIPKPTKQRSDIRGLNRLKQINPNKEFEGIFVTSGAKIDDIKGIDKNLKGRKDDFKGLNVLDDYPRDFDKKKRTKETKQKERIYEY